MVPVQSERLTSQLFILTITPELFPLRMALLILCKNHKCRYRHASELQIDRKSFRAATIENKSEKCPKCEKYLLYNKGDYFFGFVRNGTHIEIA